MQGGEKTGEGGVCLVRGSLASDQEEQSAFGGKRCMCTLGGNIWSSGHTFKCCLGSAAEKEKRCCCAVAVRVAAALCVQRVQGERGVSVGGVGTPAQIFSCFPLSNRSRTKRTGKQSPISEGNWAPEKFLSPCFSVFLMYFRA